MEYKWLCHTAKGAVSWCATDIPLAGCQFLGALPSPDLLLRSRLAGRAQLLHDSSIEEVLRERVRW